MSALYCVVRESDGKVVGASAYNYGVALMDADNANVPCDALTDWFHGKCDHAEDLDGVRAGGFTLARRAFGFTRAEVVELCASVAWQHHRNEVACDGIDEDETQIAERVVPQNALESLQPLAPGVATLPEFVVDAIREAVEDSRQFAATHWRQAADHAAAGRVEMRARSTESARVVQAHADQLEARRSATLSVDGRDG